MLADVLSVRSLKAMVVAVIVLGILLVAFPVVVTGSAPYAGWIEYKEPGAGEDTPWYNADPGAVIDIDFDAEGGELQMAQYRVADGAWQTIFEASCVYDSLPTWDENWTVDWGLAGDGAHKVDIRLKKCGLAEWLEDEYQANMSGFRFLKDTTPPTSEAVSPATSPPNEDIDTSWTVDDLCDDPTVILWYKHEGGTWQPSGLQASGTFGVFHFTPGDGLGTYYFEVVATDEAGNQEQRAGGEGDTHTEVLNYVVYLPLILRNYGVGPDLSTLRKEADQEAVDPGGNLVYTIVLTNSGNLAASVTLTDPIPAQTTFITGTAAGCSYDDQQETIRWVGTLDPEGTRTCSFSVRVNADAVGSIANTAKVHDGYHAIPIVVFLETPVRSWQRGQDLPGGLTVYSLAVCPDDANRVYAGTESSGVFVSVDGGRAWTPTALGGEMVWGVAFEPGSNCQVAYATTWGKGIIKTGDGGATWGSVNTGLGDLYLYTVAIDPAKTVYAGTYNEGVFKSTNGGSSWSVAGLPGREVDWLAIDPGDPQILYAATWGQGVFKSTDGAGSWSQINAGLSSLEVYAVAIDPQDTDVVYAATYGRGIFCSVDGGANWGEEDWGSRIAYAVSVRDDSWAYAGTDGMANAGAALWECPVTGGWRAMVPQPGGGQMKVRSLAFSGFYHLAGTTDGVWWYGVAP